MRVAGRGPRVPARGVIVGIEGKGVMGEIVRRAEAVAMAGSRRPAEHRRSRLCL